jgi:photosystem II stability/assembly factor-like uncharacterized protein
MRSISRLMKTFYSILLGILCPLTMTAQWRQQSVLPLSNNDRLRGISFLSDQTFFICSSFDIFKTTNGGQTWQSVYANTAPDPIGTNLLDLHFYSPTQGLATGLFYIANDEVVVGTTNGGNNWTINYLNSPYTPPVVFNAMDVSGSNVLVCGFKGHIIRSTNFGSSFSAVNTPTNVILNEIKFINASKAIAIGEGVLLKTTNAGLTWAADPNFNNKSLSSIAVSGSGAIYVAGVSENRPSIFKSVNEGVNFSQLSLPFVESINGIAASHDTVLVSTSKSIFVSVNGGNSWQQFKNQVVSKIDIYNGKAYAFNSIGLLALDMRTMQPEPVAYFTSNVDLQCGQSTLNVTTSADTTSLKLKWYLNDTLISTGRSFSKSYDSLPWYAQKVTLVVTNISNSKTDTLIKSETIGFRKKVVANIGADIYQCYGGQTYLPKVNAQFTEWFPHDAFKILDNNYGAEYVTTKPLYADTEIRVVAWNDSRCYAYDTLTIFVGAPQEEHFNFNSTNVDPACSNASCVSINDMDFVSDSVGFGTTTSGYFIKTKDAGKTWSKSRVGAGSVDFLDENVGYIGKPFSKTTNGGQTFTLMSVAADDLSFINKDTGIVAFIGGTTPNYTKIYKTLNGGQTFTKLYDALTAGDFNPHDIKMVNANLIFAGGVSLNKPALLRSVNGGATWTALKVASIYAIPQQICAFSADTLFYLDDGFIHRTYNGGNSWFSYLISDYSLSTGSGQGSLKMFDKQNGYASIGRMIFKTTNGGDCWTEVFTADWLQNGVYSAPHTYAMSFAPSGRSVYFSADDVYATESPVVFHQRFYRELKGTVVPVSCANTPIRTRNQSFGYTRYRWYINDSLQATAYDTELKFTNAGDYRIKMIADSMGLFPATLNFTLHIKAGLGSVGKISGPSSVCALQGPSATFRLPDSLGFTRFKWFQEFSDLFSQRLASVNTSGDNKLILYLSTRSEGTVKIRAMGKDTLGCISSDTASFTLKIQTTIPPNPTLLTIDASCLTIDSSSFINGQIFERSDSIHCIGAYAPNTDSYIFSPDNRRLSTPIVTIPNFATCYGTYDIQLYNENACGESRGYLEQSFDVKYGHLNIVRTPDTVVARNSPATLRVNATLDPIFKPFACNPLPVIEWRFKNVLLSRARFLQFSSVTSADTGVYTAYIYNVCDTVKVPIRLSIGKVRVVHIDPRLDTVRRSIVQLGFLNIKLSPNPNTGVFEVELPISAESDMRLCITDLLGQVIIEKQAAIGSKTQIIEAAELVKGLYFLQVVAEGKIIAIEKFVKQ